MNKAPKPTTPVYQWERSFFTGRKVIERQLVSKTDKTATFQYENAQGEFRTAREILDAKRPLFPTWKQAHAHMLAAMLDEVESLTKKLATLNDEITKREALKDPTK